jgi:lipoprotein-releasing system ATP-binding protein
MSDEILRAQAVTKSYTVGGETLRVLKGIDLVVHRSDALCILGSSGAGKSTLLHILGSLDEPTTGRVLVKGRDLTRLSEDEKARLRNEKMGFVFQFHHLLAEFNALENVMLPCRIAGLSKGRSEVEARRILDLLGLSARWNHFPAELSGGEQQRVAIARALVNRPEILLADEPTGNLDSANSERLGQLLFELRRELKLTLVVVTHDQQLAQFFPLVRTLKDGQWVD